MSNNLWPKAPCCAKPLKLPVNGSDSLAFICHSCGAGFTAEGVHACYILSTGKRPPFPWPHHLPQ